MIPFQRPSGLHILQIYHDTGPGGAEQMIVDLCRWLRLQGHRLTVVTSKEGWLSQRLAESEIEALVIPKRRRLDFTRLGQILRVARERQVDVIHAHEFQSIVGAAMVALWGRFPLVATVHGREYIASRRRRVLIRLAGQMCRQLVAVSQATRDFLVRDLKIPQSKVTTIYNGVDAERYKQVSADEKTRQALGIPAGARVIGTVGSLYPVKGQTYLLQAMARVVHRFPQTVCLIAGRGELSEALRREANALNLNGNLKLLGYRTDVPELLSAMELFVLPSLSEGLPLSLLEAQACGLPVVASDVGGNSEVVEEGKSGYLVPPSHSDVLADRILSLLENPATAVAMGDHGRKRVQEIFSLQSMARNYLSLYRSCLN